MGDPAGIGPEIVLKAVSLKSLQSRCRFVVYGDAGILRITQKTVLRHHPASKLSLLPTSHPVPGHVKFVNVGHVGNKIRFGKATAEGGRMSGLYIEEGVRAAKLKKIDALVTGPINKLAFKMGGNKYVGHTEMLAGLSGTKSFSLMMVHGPLRSMHVTSHIPLKRVARNITKDSVSKTIELAQMGARMLGIRKPRIAVCGLNPHAGDGGVLGVEDKNIIAPAIQKMRKKRINVQGPFPGDTLWPRVMRGDFDIGVAMYHDQGQIPLKLNSFYVDKKGCPVFSGVNVTVGLPFVRTSVAHGSAYDIAGRGTASEAGMVEAVKLALDIVQMDIIR